MSREKTLRSMNAIQPSELPQEALLARYKQEGAYTDCYSVAVPHVISHAEYVAAFYTTALFKTERLIPYRYTQLWAAGHRHQKSVYFQ
jgi:hypothetical protein